MKYGRLGIALLTAAALLAGLPPKALADSNARIVRLSYVDGDTQIDNRDGRGFAHAFANMPLVPGTQVSTGNDGRAEIEFEDMSTVRLTPGTLVQTQSLDLRSSGAKYTMVDLQDGTAYFNIRKLDDDNDFRVDSGRREFSPTRASRFRLRVDRAQVVLSVFSGEVEVIGQGSSLTVRKNETLTLDSEDPARYFLAKGISSDRYDEWDQERDEYREQYAKSASYTGYSSAYSYGVSDLNYWGSYTYIAGYGNMWRPYSYGVNWNPYANGGWYWYPGSGWIWVSAYPWGWMPFHYGSWYYISGHGWCWRPGNQWHHWSPVVAVHNPPPGHHSPALPPSTGRHDPVLVGHGPATILPSEDPGRLPGVRNPNVLDKRGGRPVVGGGSGGTGAPVAGGSPTAGSGVNTGSGSSGLVGSGGGSRPSADSGGSPSGRRREVELEDAIQNARERRLVGGQAGGVITNSGPAISVSSGAGSSSSDSGSGAAAGGSSPTSGRERIPEPRRQLPPSITRDEPAPSPSAGSSDSANYRWVGSTSDSSAASSAADSTPSAGGGRTPEPRRDVPRESFVPSSSGSSASGSSSSGAGSSRSSYGGSGSGSAGSSGGGSGNGGGSTVHSSAPSGSGSGGGSGSSGGSGGGRSSGVGSGSSSGSSSGGSRSSSAGSSAGHSSGGRSSGSGSSGSSSTSSTPK